MRIPEDCNFEASDGTSLFYRYWPCEVESAARPRAIILLHRGHEHSGRMQHVVDELNLPEFAMFAWDARGHGRSRVSVGDRPTVGTFVSDLDAFAKQLTDVHGIAPEEIAVVAQSVGSAIAATWVHDYAPPIRSMVLAAPAFKIKLYIPLARQALRLLTVAFSDPRIKSYVKPQALTHDAERIASYRADPLITRPISARILLGLYSTSSRVIEDAAAIETPTQVLISGSDFVVHKGPQHRFFRRLGSKVKEEHVFPGFYHDTLGERDRRLAIEKARGFILRSFQTTTEVASRNPEPARFTKDEYERLSQPLPAMSAKRWAFAMSRRALRIGARLSHGIRLGRETGFDSGSTLDYVYRNKPAGFTPIGSLIDRLYLNSIGWRGIRVRRRNIERLLCRTAGRLRDAAQPIRVADIAAGHGRYVLDAFKKAGIQPDGILLRDFDERNVREGAQLICENNMCGVARFERGDAFHRESIASLNPRPTLGIVSGLYELFPDNHLVQQSLAGLAEAIVPGGYLIYTGQPWHPQLETIARVLSSHRHGQPWVMRRRTQRELDSLVAAAGFRKIDQEIDEWGMFTVSVAQRV